MADSTGLVIPNESNTSVTLAGGEVYSNTTINAGGRLTLSNGTIVDTVVSSGGMLYFYANATAIGSNTTVAVGGLLNGYGFAEEKTWESITGTVIHVVPDVVKIAGYKFVVISSGVAEKITLAYASCNMHVSSGGTANDTVVLAGSLTVANRGTASGTVVSGGGMVVNHSKAVVSNTVVYSGGTMYLSNGAVVHNTVLSGGYIKISGGQKWESQGFVSGVEIYNGGTLYVGKGLVSGAHLKEDGAILTVHTGDARIFGTVVSGGLFELKNFCSATDTIVSGGSFTMSTGNAGTIHASYGVVCGILSNTKVYGGKFDAQKGSASGVEIFDGGLMVVNTAATISDVTVHAGGLLNGFGFAEDKHYDAIEKSFVQVAENVTISGTNMTVAAGGTAENIIVGTSGNMHVSSGGTANDAVVDNGGLMVVFGGEVNDAVVSSGGSIYLSYTSATSGNLYNTVIMSGGRATVVSGAAYNTDIYDGGNLALSRIGSTHHGSAYNTVIHNGGKLIAGAYTSAYDTIVKKGGFMQVGELVSKTTVDGGYISTANGGGRFEETIINSGGRVILECGAVASDTFVYSGGSFTLKAAGTIKEVEYAAASASNTTVNSGGKLIMEKGAKATNASLGNGGILQMTGAGTVENITVQDGFVVSAAEGVAGFLTGNIAFDLTGDVNGAATAIIKNSWLTGDVTCSVKVDDFSKGTFALVDGGTFSTVNLQIGNGTEYTLTAAAGEYIYDFAAGLQYSVSADGSFRAEDISAAAMDNIAKNVSFAEGTGVNGSDAEKAVVLTDLDNSKSFFAAGASGITSDVNGWLTVDKDFNDATGKGKVYGGASTADAVGQGTVNIRAAGAAIGNLLGGGAAGSTDNNINIEIGNAVVATGEGNSTETKETTIKALYGGGHGNVSGNINIGINGGKITSQLVGGTVRTTETANVTGEINLTVTDIEFTGSNIVGGSYINFTTNTAAASVGSVSVSFAGGTAASANLYGAGYAYSNTAGVSGGNVDYTVDTVTIDITGGAVGSRLNGRGIFGGVFANNVDAVVENGVNITISGADTVAGNIFGGGWAQQGGVSNVTGGVNITIESGSANVIYGGGAHSSTSNGSTTVDSVNITVKGGSAKAVYAGGQTTDDKVTGDATVTVTGRFATATNFYGTGWDGVDTVNGKSTLHFAGYYGKFTGTIANFDEIIFSGDAVANLRGADIDATALTIDLTGRTYSDTAVVGLDADSKVTSIDIKAGTAASVAADVWTIVSAAGDTITDFDLYIGDAAEAIDLTVGEALTSGIFAGWGISKVESEGTVTYKFGLLA